MAIRQRAWATPTGKKRSAWVVDYFDVKGKRRLKTFRTKREADDWRSETKIELKQGTHVADRDSITVAAAGKLWLIDCEERDLVKSSRVQNEGHLRLHIEPFLAETTLNELTLPAVRAFESKLLANGRSKVLTRKVLTSLGGIIGDAMERGLATRNPVHEMRANRGKRRKKGTRERKRLLKVGEDIPTPSEVKAILEAASKPGSNRWPGFRRAFFATAALCGLRSSELRGLRWQDVDLAKATLSVRQRADQWGEIDLPKSEAGERTIPLPPLVVNALKEWKLACPRRDTGRKDADGNAIMELHYVFPNGKGHVESQQNIVKRHLHPLQVAAGVSVPALDESGSPVMAKDDDGNFAFDDNGKPVPVMAAKYTGLHALRHFFCSWCAARPQDGGLGLPLKTVQVRMGHSTLAMTADRYGHLFPSNEEEEKKALAAGERALMGA